jgi:hypothetical protein
MWWHNRESRSSRGAIARIRISVGVLHPEGACNAPLHFPHLGQLTPTVAVAALAVATKSQRASRA